tara:strand:+ start:64 stop:207 length:144 start_codon:yes stop_codon:yes gene_type:complete
MKKENKTIARRLKALEKLNGKYNGWWIYQYALGFFNERAMISKRRRR